MIKSPSFWYRFLGSPVPLGETLLGPVSFFYRVGYVLHQRLSKTHVVDTPVICVGNLTAGGAGKTPVCLSLMAMIHDYGLAQAPYFLTRGYGGSIKRPTVLNALHRFHECGDEALLLKNEAPVIVSADRYEGAMLAERQGADLIVMDDGLQNPTLKKDLKIIVVNGRFGFGNKKCLPAGPLRQPLAVVLAEADLFIILGDDVRGIEDDLPQDVPVFKVYLKTDPDDQPDPFDVYCAFAGIANSEKFFMYLMQDLGVDLADTIVFPDHHPYSNTDVEFLVQRAADLSARLLTTQKDRVRLPVDFDVSVVPVSVVWEDEVGLLTCLCDLLGVPIP